MEGTNDGHKETIEELLELKRKLTSATVVEGVMRRRAEARAAREV